MVSVSEAPQVIMQANIYIEPTNNSSLMSALHLFPHKDAKLTISQFGKDHYPVLRLLSHPHLPAR